VARAGTADRNLLPLLALCLGSGCAALVYQVVWFQLLSLVIGVSSVSLGIVLGTFMSGMCIGSLLLPRIVSLRHHPLRVFALTELAIGLLGLVVLAAMPALDDVYAALAGARSVGWSLILRIAIAVLCLLPPTILIGATLPALVRWMRISRVGIARMGFCYSANLFGAVVGSLLAGFYLLRVFDVTIATLAAAALNLVIALGAMQMARTRPHAGGDPRSARIIFDRSSWRVYVTVALSGLTALSAEVIWTRQLSLLLGGTVYTFSLVVAIFLFGLGLGSAFGSSVSRRASPGIALGYCQLALCAAIAWTAQIVARSLPYWPLDVTLPAQASVMLQLDLVRVLLAVGPAALLWGASFPLALAAAGARARDAGKLLGGLYAANTLGAIVGALGTALLFIVWLGSQRSQQMLMIAAACGGVLMLLPGMHERRAPAARTSATGAAFCVAAVALVWGVPPVPGELVAYGRFVPTRGIGADVVYMREGRASSLAVSREADGTLVYHNAGKSQASTYPRDLRLQRMLGHLTTLAAIDGRAYLVIGLGSGITAGAVSLDPAAERVVVVDVEPLTREVADGFFAEHNHGVLDDPKVEWRVDDGRHFLLTTDETFDGITSDPLDPWVKGAAALYTREFWELVRSRLNPHGVVTVFVQLYETTEEAVKSELATFFEVFPHSAVFANTVRGRGYDTVLLGRRDATPIDADGIDARLRLPEYERIAESLAEVGFYGAADLFGTYSGRAADFIPWLSGAGINTDRNLRLQYLAGEGYNAYRADEIYRSMMSGIVVAPSDFFIGAPPLIRDIEEARRLRARRY
jgi:spermidine synthase